MGQCLSSSATKYDDPFTPLSEAKHGMNGRRRGCSGVKLTGILSRKPGAAAELQIVQLESALRRLRSKSSSGSDEVDLIPLFELATQLPESHTAAKAELFHDYLESSSSQEVKIFRAFLVYLHGGDILQELLSKGHSVLDLFGKTRAVKNCDLSQYASMSDTDRRVARLGASEVLFGLLLPLHQPCIFMCCCNRKYQNIRSNSETEQLILRTMQACNKTATGVLGWFLASCHFLIDVNPHGLLTAFKCLAALGFDPSLSLQSVQHIEGYRACVDYWRSQPQLSLQHLARVAVRDAITTNVVHAAPRLGLPASLQSYLLLEDILGVAKNALTAAEGAERC